MRVCLMNINLDPAELDGCRRIAATLQGLGAQVQVLPFAAVRQDQGLLEGTQGLPEGTQGLPEGTQGLVLGPQGTPFSSYDAGFLPWLRALVQQAGVPVLGICGGMQALALAWGGRLEGAYGQTVGESYAGLRKVRGPLPIALELHDLPPWLPPQARDRLQAWTAAGAQAFQSHVEQVRDLPGDFTVLAHSEPTPIEAFAHRHLPILASQFHPELGWDEGCGAGRTWLEAWLAVVQQDLTNVK